MQRSTLLASSPFVRAPQQPFRSPAIDRNSHIKCGAACSPAAKASRDRQSCVDARCNRRSSETQTADVLKLPAQSSIAAAAVALVLGVFQGHALAAEDAAAQEPAMPPLPTPPEVVRNLQNQLLGAPAEEAPPLKDGLKEESPEEQKRDADLQERMESQILPKIREQLKGLDQSEHPNNTTIELKRQLRRAEDDILRLLEDLRQHKSDEAHAEASGLQREFYDIRDFVLKNGGELVPEEQSNAE